MLKEIRDVMITVVNCPPERIYLIDFAIEGFSATHKTLMATKSSVSDKCSAKEPCVRYFMLKEVDACEVQEVQVRYPISRRSPRRGGNIWPC